MITQHCAKILKCDPLVFFSPQCELSQDERQKKFVFQTYYSFIENTRLTTFIEKAYNILIKHTDYAGDCALALSIIILKSFMDKNKLKSSSEEYIEMTEIHCYVQDQFRFYLITQCEFQGERGFAGGCLHAIDLLIQFNVIKSITIKSWVNKKITTPKYLSISLENYLNPIELITLSYAPFKIIKYNSVTYIISTHYSNMFEIYKKNKASGRGFISKNEQYILSKINTPLYVDEEYQKDVLIQLRPNEEQIKEDMKKNNKLMRELFENKEWTHRTKIKISELQSKNSELLNLLIYSFFCKLDFKDFPIYFPMYLDFRGRKYYYSRIGPTSSKILRLCYHYGWYSQNDFNTSDAKHYTPYIKFIKLFCSKYKILDCEKYYEHYFWLMISIGKLFKDKNKTPVLANDFLQWCLTNYESALSIVDQLELNHYKRIIRDISEQRVKKRAIQKDATSSIYQILMLKLGPLDQLSMDYVNLGNTLAWNDTYLITIDLFHKYILSKGMHFSFHDKNKLLSFIPRKLAKHPVMVIPYSASNKLCWNKYVNTIKEENLNIPTNMETKNLMYAYYNFIRKEMQTLYFFKASPSNFCNKIKEDFESLRIFVMESETGAADLSYFKLHKGSIEKRYKLNKEKRRITIVKWSVSLALNLEEFTIALMANIVHFYDANELTDIELLLEHPILTIHDCYLIDFKECGKLIDLKIIYYQKKIDKIAPGYKINNIFILL